MYTPSDQFQFQAWAIQQGIHHLAPEHLEIMDWISNQFGVRALDFFCETRRQQKGLPQQLVHVILETVEDLKRMQANRAGNAVVTARFLEHFKSQVSGSQATDPLKRDVFPIDTQPFPEIILTYRPLKAFDREMITAILENEKQAILKAYPSVWTVSQNVVFYHTKAQVKENQTNGTSAKISEELAQADKKHGADPRPPYCFDSKESFDRDYEGNWYYYWK